MYVNIHIVRGSIDHYAVTSRLIESSEACGKIFNRRQYGNVYCTSVVAAVGRILFTTQGIGVTDGNASARDDCVVTLTQLHFWTEILIDRFGDADCCRCELNTVSA